MDTSPVVDDCLFIDLNSVPLRNSSDDARKIEFEVLESESKSSVKDEPDPLIDQLNRMKSENKKLTEMLIILCENYNALQSHLRDLMQKYSGDELAKSQKRKLEGENSVCTLGNDGSNESICYVVGSPSTPKEIRTNISRVYIRTDPSETSLTVKDGYHWRKYGQKVTKDNPSPRAYFKCSFSPSCSVKKKVQRSVEDSSILVATYEGEHNHQHPLRDEMLVASTEYAASVSAAGSNCFNFSGLTRTTEFTDAGPCNKFQRPFPTVENDELQQLMVEQMASSLTRNSSFKAALVGAISRRILSQDPAEK